MSFRKVSRSLDSSTLFGELKLLENTSLNILAIAFGLRIRRPSASINGPRVVMTFLKEFTYSSKYLLSIETFQILRFLCELWVLWLITHLLAATHLITLFSPNHEAFLSQGTYEGVLSYEAVVWLFYQCVFG